MSAIDDTPDYERGGLVDTIDTAFPCCTLCDDTARWPNGMICICVGDFLPRQMQNLSYPPQNLNCKCVS